MVTIEMKRTNSRHFDTRSGIRLMKLSQVFSVIAYNEQRSLESETVKSNDGGVEVRWMIVGARLIVTVS